MSLLTRPHPIKRRGFKAQAPGPAAAEPTAPEHPLPAAVRLRVQLSGDLVAALLELEGRDRATLDDLEWADALATRMASRYLERAR